MRIVTTMLCAAGAAALLGGCADNYNHRSGFASAAGYDGYYDGYYGVGVNAYLGSDGAYYYSDSGGNRHRDDGHHFRRDAGDGYHEFHGHADSDGGR